MKTIDESILDEGLNWEQYLQAVPLTRVLQTRRYNEFLPNSTAHHTDTCDHLRGVMLVEAACGDCAWTVPKAAKMLKAYGIKTLFFLRSDWPELQDQLLTKGKRSVPKLALVDPSGTVVAEWGPRPEPIQAYVERSVGVLERSEWASEVLRYYKGPGAGDLREELGILLSALCQEADLKRK